MASYNPYLDPSLMNGLQQFTPQRNTEFIEDHHGNGVHTNGNFQGNNDEYTDEYIDNEDYDGYEYANSNEANGDDNYNEIVGIPIGTGLDNSQDKEALSLSELKNLCKNEKLFIYSEDEDAWCPYTFIEYSDGGVLLHDTANEDIFIFCEDDLPIIFKMSDANNENSDCLKQSETANKNAKNENDNLNYKIEIGMQISITQSDKYTPCTVMEYDLQSTKATLKDASGSTYVCYLNATPHEVMDNSVSKRLEITSPNELSVENGNGTGKEEKSEDTTPIIVRFYDLKQVSGVHDWEWISEIDKYKLKWVECKNTLIGCIACLSRPMYPINLEYIDLMLISGNGFAFSWTNDVSLFNPEMLSTITSFCRYKFTVHDNSSDSSWHNNDILSFEKQVIQNISDKICSIVIDGNGHFALILGFCKKDISDECYNQNPSKYWFKIKCFESAGSDEYFVVDICDCDCVIFVTPPQKIRPNSFRYTLTPKKLRQIVSGALETHSDGILNLEIMEKQMIKGQMSSDAQFILDLGRTTILALIRLYDSRDSMKHSVRWLHSQIKNAFNVSTHKSDADNEWKLETNKDISDELTAIEQCLEKECNKIKEQTLYKDYCVNYDGQVLDHIEWQPYHRIHLKIATQFIKEQEIIIHKNLKIICKKLVNV